MDRGRRQARGRCVVLCGVMLAAVAAFAIALAAGRSAAAGVPRCSRFAQAPRTATLHQLRTSVLCLVDRARERHHIPPLHFNPELRQSATGLSEAMVRTGSLSHYGPGGSTLTTRIARTGYLARVASFRVAENIGAGEGRRYGSPLAILQEWMHSPEHRRNILDRGLHDFGVGVARGDPFGGRGNAATYTLDFAARRRH